MSTSWARSSATSPAIRDAANATILSRRRTRISSRSTGQAHDKRPRGKGEGAWFRGIYASVTFAGHICRSTVYNNGMQKVLLTASAGLLILALTTLAPAQEPRKSPHESTSIEP